MSTTFGRLLASWPLVQPISTGADGTGPEAMTARTRELRHPDGVVYDPRETSVGGTHAIFVVRGRPEEYNLPSAPEVPTVHLAAGWGAAAFAAGLMLAGTFAASLTPSSRRRIPAD